MRSTRETTTKQERGDESRSSLSVFVICVSVRRKIKAIPREGVDGRFRTTSAGEWSRDEKQKQSLSRSVVVCGILFYFFPLHVSPLPPIPIPTVCTYVSLSVCFIRMQYTHCSPSHLSPFLRSVGWSVPRQTTRASAFALAPPLTDT